MEKKTRRTSECPKVGHASSTLMKTNASPGGSSNNKQRSSQNNLKKNNKKGVRAALINAKAVASNCGTGSPVASPDLTSAFNSKMLLARTKNEEAISDLRQRIPEIDNIFDVHSRIGNGTFSTVLLGTLKRERDLPESLRRKFAIKHHVPTSHPERIMKELQCMARIGGTDNVVGINFCIRYNESVAFIMPYMPHDRFYDFFCKMDIAELQCYMRNLLIALRHVHKFNVIHRDVKPSNFLYNRRKRQFLLVDFGLAQQVPTSQSRAAGISDAYVNNGAYMPLGSAAGLEGKRMLVQDKGIVHINEDISIISGDLSGIPKRLRCTGPNEDQQTVVAPIPNSKSNNYINPVNGTTFKMPLKQLNEITSPGKHGNVTPHNANTGICDPTNCREIKSNVLNSVISNRFQQKGKHQLGGSNCGRTNVTTNSNSVSTLGPSTEPVASSIDATNSNSKYNTNRNLNVSSNSKCYCYGCPQVCNICLIKKEIHASRAGTPGYRPPEVLLKYAEQTTAVDMWAAGVIFLSILSSVYPFFKAPNDFIALAEMVTIFGDKIIRKTAFLLDRLVTLNQRTKPLDLRKLCVRFRNRVKYSSQDLFKKYQRSDGTCEICKNCDQFFFNCLCSETNYNTEPLDGDDIFPPSAYDLLYKLLEVNPHKRITAEEALKHPFFTEHIQKMTNTQFG